MSKFVQFLTAAFAMLCLSFHPASAAECPRGDLDKAYCDTNGDLVADTLDKTVNPSTLVFAYTPVEDASLYTRMWDGFLRHLEKVTGKIDHPALLHPGVDHPAGHRRHGDPERMGVRQGKARDYLTCA